MTNHDDLLDKNQKYTKEQITSTGYRLLDDKQRCVFIGDDKFKIWFKYDDKKHTAFSIDSEDNKRYWKFNKYGDMIYFEDSETKFTILAKYDRRRRIKYYTEISENTKKEISVSYKRNRVDHVRVKTPEGTHLWIYDKKGQPTYHSCGSLSEYWYYNELGRVNEYKNNSGMHLIAEYDDDGKFKHMKILDK